MPDGEVDPAGAVIELDTELRAQGDSMAPGFVYVPNVVPTMDMTRGFQLAVADLRAAAEDSGRSVMFAVFERYDLVDPADSRPTYAEIARELSLTPATVTNHLAAMRRQFRRHVLDRLRDLTTSDEEFEAEARRLLGGSS